MSDHDMSPKMHADEVSIDTGLMRRLLSAQFPQWDDLLLERASAIGTDNAIFRLGDDMGVRAPYLLGSRANRKRSQLARTAQSADSG